MYTWIYWNCSRWNANIYFLFSKHILTYSTFHFYSIKFSVSCKIRLKWNTSLFHLNNATECDSKLERFLLALLTHFYYANVYFIISFQNLSFSPFFICFIHLHLFHFSVACLVWINTIYRSFIAYTTVFDTQHVTHHQFVLLLPI